MKSEFRHTLRYIVSDRILPRFNILLFPFSSPQYDSSQRQYKSRGGAPPPSEANNGYRTSNPDPGYRAPSLYESRDPGYRNPEVGYRSSASLHDPTYRSNYPNGYRYNK